MNGATVDRALSVALDLLTEAERRARRDGGRLPTAYRNVRDALKHVTGRQGATTLDASGEAGEGDAMTPLLLDYEEVADSLHLSRRTVERLAKTGELPVVRVAGKPRVRRDDLVSYVAGLPKEQA
ncbi:MAG: helix-turn-helix domain-containing protein [Actinomycetota bacterium]|nr:helix-turn-helix domain-containing protein [Actinomycetota bacterium]